MDDLLNREYNGWENKCTWLVHLHLKNGQTLFLEIANLIKTWGTYCCTDPLRENEQITCNLP